VQSEPPSQVQPWPALDTLLSPRLRLVPCLGAGHGTASPCCAPCATPEGFGRLPLTCPPCRTSTCIWRAKQGHVQQNNSTFNTDTTAHKHPNQGISRLAWPQGWCRRAQAYQQEDQDLRRRHVAPDSAAVSCKHCARKLTPRDHCQCTFAVTCAADSSAFCSSSTTCACHVVSIQSMRDTFGNQSNGLT
jgi:hypothetical protein